MNTPRVTILVGSKGRGTNMSALIRACQAGEIPAEVAGVIGSHPGSAAQDAAESLRIPFTIVQRKDHYAADLIAELERLQTTWICLAGYLWLLPKEVLERFPGRVLNIHPALLPKFGGPGMYGMRVHEAVLQAGEKESGCSVHYVTEHYDEGDVVFQLRCPVLPDDTPESLSKRVLELEHRAYPEALRRLIDG